MDEQNTQYTVKNVPVFVPIFLYAVTMLIFQIKRNVSSEKRFNDVITFFWKVPKIWVSQRTLNGEKKNQYLRKNLDKDIGVIDNNLPLSIFIDFHLINQFY